MAQLIEQVGLIAAVILPFWNIPLIARIVRRGSSEDVSIAWAVGVWVCLIFLAPAALSSKDVIWKTFNAVNLILFTFVVIAVFLYRKKGPSHSR